MGHRSSTADGHRYPRCVSRNNRKCRRRRHLRSGGESSGPGAGCREGDGRRHPRRTPTSRVPGVLGGHRSGAEEPDVIEIPLNVRWPRRGHLHAPTIRTRSWCSRRSFPLPNFSRRFRQRPQRAPGSIPCTKTAPDGSAAGGIGETLLLARPGDPLVAHWFRQLPARGSPLSVTHSNWPSSPEISPVEASIERIAW